MMNYVLCGWYMTEFGLKVFEVEGLDLEACVAEVSHDSDEFGHTYMELNCGVGTPDYDVTSKVIKMVCAS